jgi:hypothetical protein
MRKVADKHAVAASNAKIKEITDVFEDLGLGHKPGER